MPDPSNEQVRGHYVVHEEIAAGGMATVHLGRLRGPAGFAKTVAIKQLHAHFAKDPEFLAMFLDEARLASRIRHPNVVSTLDVVVERGSVQLVMEYVHGESLSRLWRAARDLKAPIPPAIAIAIMTQVLYGLHAAHEARAEDDTPLGIVHRDVSPQNVLVGADGIARVLDFGIAKAALQAHSTRDGQLKGKIAYMAPEQVLGEKLDRRADVFSAGIVLWEALVGERLFHGDSPTKIMSDVLHKEISLPGATAPDIPPALDEAMSQALARPLDQRFQTARAFAVALEGAVRPATAREVSEWVESIAGDVLEARASLVAAVERGSAATAVEVGPDEATAPPDVRRKRTTLAQSPGAREEIGTNAIPVDVTASGALEDEKAPRARNTLAASILVAGIVVVLGGFALRSQVQRTARMQSALTPTSSAAASTSSASVPPSVEPAPLLTQTAAPTVASASSASATKPRSTAPHAHATSSPVTAPAMRATSQGPDPCSPPYDVLADGTHRFKPECVH